VESLLLDTRVTRVTKGKEAGPFMVRELTMGDEFTHQGKHYLLTTKRVMFGDCDTGQRIRYGRSWYVVCRHGPRNILFPCVPSDDMFSAKLSSNHSVFPWPGEMMELLTFEELTAEPVPAGLITTRLIAP